MFIQDRDSARKFFIDAWRKYRSKLPLEPMEKIVSGVILQHPEYHAFLENGNDTLNQEFTTEMGKTNPFLHMGMHISIQEQLGSDRPQGITALYQKLLPKFASNHDLEHRMMDCLGEVLWAAQRDQVLPSETVYLECLKNIA
jgi:hypothetical protein